jgi:hypothetical protein
MQNITINILKKGAFLREKAEKAVEDSTKR